MATSSILKQFIVRDLAAFEDLLLNTKDAVRADNAYKGCPSLEAGREALKWFSLSERTIKYKTRI